MSHAGTGSSIHSSASFSRYTIVVDLAGLLDSPGVAASRISW